MLWPRCAGRIARAEERTNDTAAVGNSLRVCTTTTACYSIRQPAFFRLVLFANQLKRIRRNLERIKRPRGSIPRVSPVALVVSDVVVVVVVLVVVVVENSYVLVQELETRRNVSRMKRANEQARSNLRPIGVPFCCFLNMFTRA